MKYQRKLWGEHLWVFLFLCCCIACTPEKTSVRDKILTSYTHDLAQTTAYLDAMLLTNQLDSLQELFVKSKLQFKRLEPILAATDKENYKFLNGPNLPKVYEEDLTDIKVLNPVGFQVIEEHLFVTEQVDSLALKSILKKTRNRLRFLSSNIALHLESRHVLWLLRDAIIRVATMGITGFDSPVLSNSLAESAVVYGRLEEILKYCKDNFKEENLFEEWMHELQQSRKALKGDFDAFNRYDFVKNHTQMQMDLWAKTVYDWGVVYDFELAIRHDATSLFSPNTFNLKYFSDYKDNPYNQPKAMLGKMLFNDERLSKNADMSCATCHQQKKAFTDGLKMFSNQRRNTPTLTYATLQKGFFYDMRSGSLEGQIISVVENENEFHASLDDLEEVVAQDTAYKVAFDTIYDGLSQANIRNAIATYIRQLNTFDSKFDNNMNGLEASLTKEEIRGFNLFMGRAACATCHFPPTFNGTVPPYFNETEMEAIGTPLSAEGLTIDDDLGRFHLFETPERKHFFKTSTIRNIDKTAPYMHNGVFNTLEEVVDFYNKGGGLGMGLDVPFQTLPSDSLLLDKQEVQAIVAFMKTLTDQRFLTE